MKCLLGTLFAIMPFAVFYAFAFIDNPWIHILGSLVFIGVTANWFLSEWPREMSQGIAKGIAAGAIIAAIVFFILAGLFISKGSWSGFLTPYHMAIGSLFVASGILRHLARYQKPNKPGEGTA